MIFSIFLLIDTKEGRSSTVVYMTEVGSRCSGINTSYRIYTLVIL